MSFIVNDEEWEILFNEPPELFKVYCALRKDMDIATGVTGIRKRISEQYIREVLYVDKIQGRASSKQEKTTRETIRSIIKRLEKLGLITNKGPFVFFLNLAITDKSVKNNSNQTTTRTTTITATKPNEAEPAKQAGSQVEINESGTRTTTSEILNNNPPPLSVIKEKDITNVISQKKVYDRRFEEFFKAYPRKENKKKAYDVWQRKNLDGLAEKIIADVSERKLRHRSWLEGYIPHATTYLNGERWEDEIIEVSNANNPAKNKSRTATFWDTIESDLKRGKIYEN